MLKGYTWSGERAFNVKGFQEVKLRQKKERQRAATPAAKNEVENFGKRNLPGQS
jgi:hypothetical protein